MDTHAAALAKKVAYLLDAKLIVPSELVTACNVSKQAITGWRKTGRIAKGHLQVIADMANVPVEWLIDGQQIEQSPVTPLRQPRPRWPFKLVSWERYLALSREDRADLDKRLDKIVRGYEASGDDDRKSSPASRAS